jgi:hypothetical protein
LRLEQLRESARHVGRLVAQLVFGVLDLSHEVAELAAHVVLLTHHLLQRAEVGVEQVQRSLFAVEIVLPRLAIGLQLCQVGLELCLQRVRPLAGDDRVGGCDQRLVQTL